MAQEYQWSRSAVSARISILNLVYGIGGFFTGLLIDRIAPRWLITAGAIFTAAGLLLTTLVRESWHFYITYGLICGTGAGCFGVVVCNSSVGKWFIRMRLGDRIAFHRVAFGTMIMTPLAGYIVKVYGWQTGFVLMAVSVVTVGVLLSQILMGRTRPEDYGLKPDGDGEAVHGPGPAVAGGPRMAHSLRSVLVDSRFFILAVCYGLAVMISWRPSSQSLMPWTKLTTKWSRRFLGGIIAWPHRRRFTSGGG